MSIWKMTVAEAGSGIFWGLLRGALWVTSLRLTCYFLDVEWSWRIFGICAATSIADAVIYGRGTQGSNANG